MAAFSIQCPECNAVLKSSKPVPAGKHVTCPKCDVTFSAPETRAAQSTVTEVEVVEDEYDAVEIVDESPVKKPGGAAVATKPKRRRPREEFRKKSNPWPMILGISGGILGVAVLAVGGYFAVKFLMTSRASDPLVYVPENPGMMAGVDLGYLMNNTQFGPAIESAMNTLPPLMMYKQETNIDYKSSMDKIVLGLGQFVGGQPGTVSIALNSKSPLDKEKLASKLGVQAATVGGRNAFENKVSQIQKLVLMVPNPNLAAFYIGHPNNVDEAVRLGGRSLPKPDTEKMMKKAAEGHVWMVIDFTIPGIRDQMSTSGPMATPATRDMMNNMICIGFWAKLNGSDVDITTQFLTPNEGAAKALNEQMQKEQKAQKGNLIMQGMALAMGATGLQKDLQDTEKYEIEGSAVTYTAKIKLDNLKTVFDRMSSMPGLIPNMGGGGGDFRGGRPGGR